MRSSPDMCIQAGTQLLAAAANLAAPSTEVEEVHGLWDALVDAYRAGPVPTSIEDEIAYLPRITYLTACRRAAKDGRSRFCWMAQVYALQEAWLQPMALGLLFDGIEEARDEVDDLEDFVLEVDLDRLDTMLIRGILTAGRGLLSEPFVQTAENALARRYASLKEPL